MGFITSILVTTIQRLGEMMSTFWGFIAACAIAILNFFAGYKVALVVVLMAVLFDMIWGVAAARKRGKFMRSELLRDTVNKVAAYATALVMVMLIENLAFGIHEMMSDEGTHSRFVVDIIATVIAAVEFWSICGNILIVYPNAVFFRLIKKPLLGEIARKLKVSEDEVEETLEKGKKQAKE